MSVMKGALGKRVEVSWKNTFVHFPASLAHSASRRTHSCPPNRPADEEEGQLLPGQLTSLKEDDQSSCGTLAQKYALQEMEGNCQFLATTSSDDETRVDSRASSGEEMPGEDTCTLMLQNLPCRATRKEVLAEVDNLGFAGLYNYYYQPPNRGQRLSRGYAFIGFVNPQAAAQFRSLMHNRTLSCRESSKQVQVLPARVQGLEENIRSFRGTRAAGKAWSPLILQNSSAAALPPGPLSGPSHEIALVAPVKVPRKTRWESSTAQSF